MQKETIHPHKSYKMNLSCADILLFSTYCKDGLAFRLRSEWNDCTRVPVGHTSTPQFSFVISSHLLPPLSPSLNLTVCLPSSLLPCLHAFQLPRQLGTCAHGSAIHLGRLFLLPHFCLPQSYLGQQNYLAATTLATIQGKAIDSLSNFQL